MPDETGGGGGGIMSHKIAGIPTILIVGGIALIAYFIFFRNSQKTGTGTGTGKDQTTGGGGSITQGNTRIDKGAVTITVSQGGTHNAIRPHGKPPPKKPPPKKPPPKSKCPKGFFWDPDDNDGKGGCVKIKGHHGPDQPGSDNMTSASNSPITNTAQTGAALAAMGGNPQPSNPMQNDTRVVTSSWMDGGTS